MVNGHVLGTTLCYFEGGLMGGSECPILNTTDVLAFDVLRNGQDFKQIYERKDEKTFVFVRETHAGGD